MKQKVTSHSTFSLLWQRIRSYRIELICILLGSFLQVLLTVYLPILMGQAIDSLLEWKTDGEFLRLLGHMAVVVALTTVFQWWVPTLSNRIVFQLVKQLRQEAFETLHRLPLSYLEQQQRGDILARISSDSEQLTNGLTMIFQQFLTGVLLILLTIVTMFELDFWMMLIVVGLTPLSLFVAHFIAKKSYRYYREQTKQRGLVTGHLEESIHNLSLVQAWNAQEVFAENFHTINESYARASQSAIFAASTVNPSTRFINALIYALLTGVGAMRILNGNFTVGELMTFLTYANQYSKPFNDISSVLSELQSALACAERLFELIEQGETVEECGEKLNSDTVNGQITFRDVSFSYQENQPLIEHLNLDIPAGSKVAIVGPTGAGKSTLINLLMRFYEVNEGEILLDGVPIQDYDVTSFRKEIGMVLQDTWLKTGTIHENIAYGYPNATRELVMEAAQAANADFFIRQLPQGYDTYLEDAGEHLSQGQRQLLAIARAFVKLPKLLILDEATSSIDTWTEILIQEAFEKLMKGRTSFIIAHRLSTIQSADRILVMVNGRIVEQGTHQTLLAAKGQYYHMHQSQGNFLQ